MLGYYFKITLRTLAKNKLYSGLNVFGLALGLAATIFIFQYVSYEKSYDKFHSNYQDLYRVRYQTFSNGQSVENSATAVPRVGPFMKENMPWRNLLLRACFPS